LEAGKTIKRKDARTYFGRLEFKVVSQADQGKILLDLTLQKRQPERLREIRLRVPHPRKHAIKQVLVNGNDWQQLDRVNKTIALEPTERHYEIVVKY
jgi:hypothetical protein